LKAIDTFEELEFERDKFSKRAIEIVKSSYDWEFVTRLYEAVTLHLLVFHNRFRLDDYLEWLNRCKYRDSLLRRNLGKFTKDEIIGSIYINGK